MAYSALNAKDTFLSYINAKDEEIHYIEGTDKRGLILDLPNGERGVVFLYPISHKKDDSKNFFDTRDSGAKERGVAWEYALDNDLKYFCFSVNDQVDRYKNYIFSLECQENVIADVSGTLNGKRHKSGTQVVIPNDWAPNQRFERKKTRNNFYITAIFKDNLFEYMQLFDNRPYMNLLESMEKMEDFLIDEWNKPRNRIFFGAPGTGKSYSLNDEAMQLVGGNDRQVERVTFHPDYTYANFVGAYKPVMKDDTSRIAYEYVPGPFMRILVESLKNSNKPYVLIVEEINRANVAAVFGDVFQLLDRDNQGMSEYSIATTDDMRNYLRRELGSDEDVSTIKLPPNMFIWATMNSADQGVYPMDTAFKRRWSFSYYGIDNDEDMLSSDATDFIFKLGSGSLARTVSWNGLRKAINDELSTENYNINEDKLMGPFFLKESALIDEETFKEVFKNKVLMYLFDDVVKQKRRLFFSCKNSNRYSAICSEFDQVGIHIFPEGVVNSEWLKEPNKEENITVVETGVTDV